MENEKYLVFEEDENPYRKTKRFTIVNQVTNDDIGKIYWDCGWRQYVSEMDSFIRVSAGCHIEIAYFINQLMENRKHDKTKKR